MRPEYELYTRNVQRLSMNNESIPYDAAILEFVSVLVLMTQISRGKAPGNSITQFASADLSELPGSHDRNRTYESDVSTFELTRAQEASYPLPVNLLSRDFDYTIREVPHNSYVEDLSNERSASVETSEGT